MVRLTQHRSISEFQQLEFIQSILKSQNPLNLIENQLKETKSKLLEISGQNQLKKLQNYILENIKRLTIHLEATAKERNSTGQIEKELIRYLRVHRKMAQNNFYFKINEKIEDNSCLQALVWSSQMEVSEEILRLISEFSFDKSMKLYYYYFKYYMSHLNLFYQNQIKIKSIFLQSSKFDFVFCHQGNTYQVHLDDLHSYTFQNALLNCYATACHINEKFQLGLQYDSYIFHALMAKIKLVLEKDRNIVARTIIASYWIFSYVDLAWIKTGEKISVLPQVFTISPDYYGICQQILSIFFIKEAQQKTQVLILELIDAIQQLQNRIGIRQLSIGLVDNITRVIDILNEINEFLGGQNKMDIEYSCAQTFRNTQNMEKLLKIIHNNFQQTTAIHNITEQIVLKLYGKNTTVPYSDKVVALSGQIILSLEIQDEQIFQISLKNIQKNPENSAPYLKTLSTLLQTNYLRQRRDSEALARKVAESEIFRQIQPALQSAYKSQLKRNQILINAINLISNSCAENPVLVLLVEETGILQIIFEQLKNFTKMDEAQNVVIILQFFHNICLKQTDFRKQILRQQLVEVIFCIFKSNLYKIMNSTRDVNNIWTYIVRLITNITHSIISVFDGFQKSLQYFIQRYKQLLIFQQMKVNTKITNKMKMQLSQLVITDKKLIVTLKAMEKCLPSFASKQKKQRMTVIYNDLLNISMKYQASLINMPAQSRFMMGIFAEACQNSHSFFDKRMKSIKHLKKEYQQYQKKQGQKLLQNVQEEIQSIHQLKEGNQKQLMEEMEEKEQKEDKVQEDKSPLTIKLKIDEERLAIKRIISFQTQQEIDQDQNCIEVPNTNQQIIENALKYQQYFEKKKRQAYVKPLRLGQASRYIYQLKYYLKAHKSDKVPRKLLDIYLQEDQFTPQIFCEAKISICSARVQKILSLLNRQSFSQLRQITRNFEQIIKVQKLLPHIQHIVSFQHKNIIQQTLSKIKGITTEAKVLTHRNQSINIISEELQGKQLHTQLNDKKSFYYCLVDSLMKFVPTAQDENMQMFKKILQYYLINMSHQINQILKRKQYDHLLVLEKCRSWVKVLLQLFCGFPGQNASKKKSQIHIFCFLMEQDQKYMELLLKSLKQILLIVSHVNVNTKANLEDNFENRVIVCERIMTKMILNRVSSFLSNCVIDFNMYYEMSSKKQKLQTKTQIAELIKQYIRQFQLFFMSLARANPFDNKVNLNEIFTILHSKIRILSKNENLYHTIPPQLDQIQYKYNRSVAQNISSKRKHIQFMTSKFTHFLQQKLIFPDFLSDYKLPIVLQKQKLAYQQRSKNNLQAENLFDEVNKQILRIAHRLFNNYPITLQYPKKVVKKFFEEEINYDVVDFRKQVKSLSNLIRIIYRMIFKIINNQEYSGKIRFTYSYLNQLMQLIISVISAQQQTKQEDAYPQEAQQLVMSVVLLLRVYNRYIFNKLEAEKIRRKQKKKLKQKANQKNKTKRKQLKFKKKKQVKQSLLETPIKDLHKEDKSEKKNKILKRDKSKVKLISTPHKMEEICATKYDRKIRRDKKISLMKLNQTLTQFFKVALQTSENNPYLKNYTLQGIMLIINKIMNYEDYPQDKDKKFTKILEVDATQILPYLLRTRINQIKHQGFFHLLSQMGVQLIDTNQIKVDLEIGVKRLFYESKSNQILLKDFNRHLASLSQFQIESLSYFLQLKVVDKEKHQKIIPLQQKNIDENRTKGTTLYVMLKDNCPLNMVNYSQKSAFRKRKSEVIPNIQEHNSTQAFKIVEYVPSKNMVTYIYQLIYNITRLIMRGIMDTENNIQTTIILKNSTKKKVDPFNITVLVQALQVIMRWSPSLTPYITKYKCRKIIQQILKEFNAEQQIKEFLYKLLGIDDKKQLTFLSLLIRGVSPLFFNKNFTIIFQMCLDNTVLQKQKNIPQTANNAIENQYVSFGQIVRHRTIIQIQQQLKRSSSIAKKMVLMNLLTTLMSIKEFSWQCIQNHSFMQTLHQNFNQIFTLFKRNNVKQLSYISKIMVIPFFISPIQLLHQLSITLQIDRKKRQNKIQQIGLILTSNKVENQLLDSEFFKIDKKFKHNWPYIGLADYPLFAEEDTLDQQSLQEDEDSQMESQENLHHQFGLQPPLQINQLSISSNSYNEHSNSWVQNQISQNSQPNQLQQESSIQLNIYPLPQHSDHIIQDSSDQEDDDDQMSIQQDSNLLDIENSQYFSEPLGSGQISEQMSSLDDIMGNGPVLFNSKDLNMYDDFDNVISYDRTDQNNPIYRTQKQQETLMKDFLLFVGGNKQDRITKLQPLKEVFINEYKMIQYTDKIQFDNFSKFQAYFWETPTIFKILKNREEDILATSTPQVIELDNKQKLAINSQNNQTRHRRQGFIYNNNNHESLIQIQRQANLMNSVQIAQQILQRNNQQEPQQFLDIEDQQDIIHRENPQINIAQLARRNRRQLTDQQLQNQLQRQGFSIQQYRNLPAEIRDDIVNNIQEQRASRRFQGVIVDQLDQLQGIPRLQPSSQSENEHQMQIQNSSSSQSVPRQHSIPSSQPHEQINQNQEGITQNHKRISLEHHQRLSKDKFIMLNKDGKNDSKFIEISDEFIFNILDLLLFTLNQSDYIYFPSQLLKSLCINSSNQIRILSTLIGILHIGPHYQTKDTKQRVLPIKQSVTDTQQLKQNYANIVYPILSLKILYILNHLSKQYSLAMTMLNRAFKPIKYLDIDLQSIKNRTLLELLIGLIQYPQLQKESINIVYLIKIINNVTQINFNAHIYRTLKTNQKTVESEKQNNATIELCQKSNQLIFSLLQKKQLKDDKHLLSSIIMRLSINKINLEHFIMYFHNLIKELATCTLNQLKQANQKYIEQEKQQNQKASYKEKVLKFYKQSKIVQLLNMFYEIMKSFNMAIPTQDTSQMVEKLKKVLLCQQIKELCQTGCQIITNDPRAPQLVAKVHQFIDCFFAVYNMLKIPENPQIKNNQKIKIASLGKISGNIQSQKKNITKKKFISDFIDLEYMWEKKICTPEGKAFINANIKNKLSSMMKSVKRDSQSLLDIPIINAAIQTPHMLEFDNKKMLFKTQIKRMKYKKYSYSIYLLINRQEVFQQSFTEIMSKRPEDLKGKLQIQFEGEEGEDAGGLTRQWYQLLSREMFNPNYALFTPSSTGNTYQPSSKSYINQQHEKYFKFIGRVMGKALNDGFLLDAYFTPAFYKHILSLPINYQDMQEEDYQFFKSLKWILNNSPIQEYMDLYFTYEFDNFGVMETRQLCQNGNERQVTQQNKVEYVELISYAKMATAVQKQLQSFLEGFYQVIPRRLIKIFDQKELQIMISGLPTIDIDDLKKNTDLVNYNKNDQIIIWFFEVLNQFDIGLRTAFLQFVTGTSRVPSDGFKGLQGFNGPQKFNINKAFETTHLPRAHTCFNQLDLPNYATKQILIQKLTLAITEAKEGFGLI